MEKYLYTMIYKKQELMIVIIYVIYLFALFAWQLQVGERRASHE